MNEKVIIPKNRKKGKYNANVALPQQIRDSGKKYRYLLRREKMKITKLSTLIAAALLTCSLFAGCSAPQTAADSQASASNTGGLYFTNQPVHESPEWVQNLDAAKDAEQLIVVAGVGKTTAYITMHEKDKDGNWQQIISTPGFIGIDGLGDANIHDAYTPVGTFTVGKAFGIADDPGCPMGYTKVDDSYYWSGDVREGMGFNQLVSTKDLPDLDTKESEHIIGVEYPYQYCLDIGYNTEGVVEKGFAFLLHCFGTEEPYTEGCVEVPEDIMIFILQHIREGCKITIDTLENFGGDFDA